MMSLSFWYWRLLDSFCQVLDLLVCQPSDPYLMDSAVPISNPDQERGPISQYRQESVFCCQPVVFSWSNFFHPEIFANVWRHLCLSQLREYYKHLENSDEGSYWTTYDAQGNPSQQGIIQPHMAIVPRLVNPTVDLVPGLGHGKPCTLSQAFL